MKFKLGWVYNNRSGAPIRVVCVDSPLHICNLPYPIIGIHNETGSAYYYDADGINAYGKDGDRLIPPEPVRCKGKFYRYRDFRGCLVFSELPLSHVFLAACTKEFDAAQQVGGKYPETRSIIEYEL